MNDRLLLEDLLVSVKSTCELLLHGTIEASTPEVRDAFNNALFESLRMQNDIYSKMSEKGWYSETKAEMNKVQQAEQKFANLEL